MNKVLIIDDDKELCTLIKRSVLSENIEADICNTGKEGLKKLKEKEYQLVILDVMMPGMDGFETLEEIRKGNSLPILMFTSKNDSASKVRGLRAGADDYLTKPFDMDELIARIVSLIRRYTRFNGQDGTPQQLDFDGLKIDLENRSITTVNGTFELPPKEFDLLLFCAEKEAAVVVREVFTLFAQGYGKTAIARMLNDRGIPNPTEYKRLHGLRYKQPKTKNSTLWKYFAISDMLINEIYIGNMVQGKYGSVSYKTKQNKPRPKSEWYIVEGTHEPIIDRELWDRVQALIEQRAKPFDIGTIGLFARKARCANCGYTMRSSKNHNKHYLQCSNRHVAKDACIGSFISVDKLEQLVIDELNRLSAEYLDKDELEQNIEFCDNLQAQKARLLSDIAVYEKKIAEYSKGIRELYMDKVKGLISESDYVEMSKDFITDRDRLERVVTDGGKQLAEIEEKIAAGDNRRELIEQYTNLEHLTREIVETLIDYISVGKRIPGTRDVPIEIHWNF